MSSQTADKGRVVLDVLCGMLAEALLSNFIGKKLNVLSKMVAVITDCDGHIKAGQCRE